MMLRHLAGQPAPARLRELRGADELALAGIDTRAAVALLDRMLNGAPSAAGELSASDRDALLAALHRALWGDRIVASIDCEACAAAFDLSFELSSLQRRIAANAESAQVGGARTVETIRGERYCLPSAQDEDAAAALGLEGGRASLAALVTGLPQHAAEVDAVAARLEALAPLIDVDLDASCPECGHAQRVRFDIQSFVLQRLLDERGATVDEVHALASGYGWGLREIVSLPRSLRRSLVRRLAATA